MPDVVPSRDLLEAIEQTVTEKLLPLVDGAAERDAKLIARAVRMLARELEQADLKRSGDAALMRLVEDVESGESAASRLVSAIRKGDLDANAPAHQALWARSVVAVSVTRPSHLSRIERRMAGLPDPDL